MRHFYTLDSALDFLWQTTSGIHLDYPSLSDAVKFAEQGGYTVWRVWTYDVWGNRREGYEVNDRYDQGFIPVRGDSNKAFLRALKDKGVLRKGVRAVSFDGDDEQIHVESTRDGYPLAGLERERP